MRRSATSIITTVLLSLSISCFAQVKEIDSTSLVNIITAKIDTFINDHDIPGAVISVVKDGELFYTQGIGYEHIEDKKKVDPIRSQFRVASITKTFTAIAIMQLVEQGKLNLHADIRTYLPANEYIWDAPYSFAIHDLLTHTSGLEHSEFRVSQAALDDGSLDGFVRTSISNQIHKPGELFGYSNKGYGILGLLIEKMSGMKYEDYIQEHILTPMGMHHSTVYQHTEENPIAQPVQPYYWDGDNYQPGQRLHLTNPAASNLNTTGYDMGRFMMAMIDSAQVDATSIISKSSFELLSKRHFTPPMEFEAMAYGMMVEDYRGYKGYNHGGGIDGFGSYYIFFPELELGLFMSESGGEENAAFGFRVIYGILDEIIEDLRKKTITNIPLEEAIEQAEKFEGTYQEATVTMSTFERGQMLFGINEPKIIHVGNGQLSHNGNIYEPIDGDTYQLIDGIKKIGFTTDANGEAKYFSERIYWTSEKIAWWQSALALQIGLGSSLVLLFVGLMIRPYILRRKEGRQLQWRSFLSLSAACMVFGFALLLTAFAFDISLRTGTPFVYKLGLWIITAGALLIALYPIELIKKWSNINKREYFWIALNAGAVILLMVCYWRINLIGFHYY